MPQVYMPAKQIIDLARNTQARIHNGKIILTARESKGTTITLIGYIQGGKVTSTDATLIEQHYSGDDQLSAIKSDDEALKAFLNEQLLQGV